MTNILEPTLSDYELNEISKCGIYKCNVLRLLILEYKRQNKKYDLSELLQFSRKYLAILKIQLKGAN